MWMVYDNEEGLVGVFSEYENALAHYEKCKATAEDWVRGEGEFSSEETIILAKVEKHLYSFDTKSPVMEEDEEGSEHPTKDTYWSWKEENY